MIALFFHWCTADAPEQCEEWSFECPAIAQPATPVPVEPALAG